MLPAFFNDNCLGFSRDRLSLSLRVQTRSNLITRERGRSQSFARLLIRGEEREKKRMNASAGSWKRDLDEETRMKLEEFLEQFPGTVENVMFFNSRDSRYQITSELMINLLMI